MKNKALVISIAVAILLFQGMICFSAAKTKATKPKAITPKSLKAIPLKDLPTAIKEKLNEHVRDFEPDREITMEEYVEIIGDEPIGYGIDLDGDKVVEYVVRIPGPETETILLFRVSKEGFDQVGEFWGELLKFGPSRTKGFLDIFGREFDLDTGKPIQWQVVWDGKKYVQKGKKP